MPVEVRSTAPSDATVKPPDHSVGYGLRLFKFLSGGRVRDYARLGAGIGGATVLSDLRVQTEEALVTRKQRRFPEYRATHSAGLMDYPWSRITGEHISKYPQAMDLGIAFHTLVYGLDDVFDDGHIKAKLYNDGPTFLKDAIGLINVQGVSGNEILGAMLTTLAYDYPRIGNRKTELQADMISYLRDYASLTLEASRKTSWTFEEALDMRKRVTGDLGATLGKVFSYASEKPYDPDASRILWCATMVGQFQDDLWDLHEENGENTHNLFLLLARERQPHEAQQLSSYLDAYTKKDHNGRIADPSEVLRLAPATYELYLQELGKTLEEVAQESSNPRLHKFNRRELDTFTNLYRIIGVNPPRETQNIVIPERIDPVARRREPRY